VSVNTLLAVGLVATAPTSVGCMQTGTGVVEPDTVVVVASTGIVVLSIVVPVGGKVVPVPTIPVVVGRPIADGVVSIGELLSCVGDVNPVVGGTCVPVEVGTGGSDVVDGVVDTRELKQANTCRVVVKVSLLSTVSIGVILIYVNVTGCLNVIGVWAS
jgi:hypothetical protein